MFTITEEMVAANKTFEGLITNQIRFCDLIEYVEKPEEFFKSAITPAAALALFKHNKEEIRQHTQSLKSLWEKADVKKTQISLTRGAFWYALQPYAKLFSKEFSNSPRERGLDRTSTLTVAEYQEQDARECAAAHKRYQQGKNPPTILSGFKAPRGAINLKTLGQKLNYLL